MSRRIMLVSEDDALRAAWKAALAEHYAIAETAEGPGALEALAQTADETECVLLSLGAPGAFDFLSARRANPNLHPIPVVAVPEPDAADGAQRALALDASDIAERFTEAGVLLNRVRNLIRLRENASLRRALERDPLTGIFNRHTFDKRTARMLRKKPEDPYQLQVWDVEHFKVINDLLGTVTGDRVLRAIAACLDDMLRGVGTYARLESDHFALCYPMRLFEPQALVDTVCRRLDELNIGLRAVLYAGVYNVENIRLSVDQMCDRATMALKTVKGKYHDRIAFYDSAMRDQLMMEQRIGSEMNTALQEGQFCFYLQPIYSITTGEPISAEALVRWNHPTRGIVPPKDFIPLFERNGFITRLDYYLWESVCRYQRRLRDEGIAPLPVSVNVSRLNLYNDHLCEDIIGLVNRYGLEPAMLKLEITESAYTDNPEQLLSAVKTLREYGFEIMMDDFGSGYSSLSMLKDLTVDILKVDMRFLAGMENNGRAANVMASIVRMAKWLEIVVIAEGVETQPQIDFLRSIGCDEVQGYFYSRPMPEEAFSALLRNPESMRKPYNSDRERLLSDFDFQSLWESNQQISLLFSGMIGAIGLYEKTGDALEVLRVNESYFELMGTSPQRMLHESRNTADKLEPADRGKLLNACDRAVKTHAVEQAQLCWPHEDGHIMWLDIKVRHLGSVSKQELFYFALADITRQKELERNFLLYQYGAAMLDAYSEVVEMNYTDNLATVFSFNSPSGGYSTRTVGLEQILRHMVEKRVHPEDQAAFSHMCSRETLEAAFHGEGRRSLSFELRIRAESEPYHWARLTLHPMDDPTGKFRALCCGRDIDEQKQTERMRADLSVLQAKQQEQERYRVILEQTQTALLAWNSDADHAEGNALAQKYRLSAVSCRALLSGDIPGDIAAPEDMPALRAFLANLQYSHNACRLLRLTLTNGELRWCKLCIAIQQDPQERISTILATVNDVDHEHRIQLQLDNQREQNERRLSMLSHLYWTLPCCILQLDLHDPPQPIFFNRACWELFGFETKDAFDAVADRELFSLILPEERDGFLAALRRCRDENTVENINVTVVRPSGERGSLRGSAAMSHMSDGRPMVQLVLLDTTEQREQERRLENTRATLERTTDMLQHLLESLPVGVTLFEFGSTPQAQYINSRAYHMFGLEAGRPARFIELIRLNRFHLGTDEAGQGLQAVDAQGVNLGDVAHVLREDGSAFWLRTYYSIAPQTSLPPLCYAVLVDVSKQMEMERAYNRQSELYRLTMEDSRQIFFDYDLEKDVMYYTLRMPTGQREDRVVPAYTKSVRHSPVIHGDHIPAFVSSLRRALRTQSPGSHEFLADFYGTGDHRWYRAYYRSLMDERGMLYRMIGRVVDIQEEKHREEQLGQAKVFRRAVNSVSLFVFAFDLPEMAPRLLSCEDVRRSGFHPYLEYLTPGLPGERVHPDEHAALVEALDAQTLLSLYRAGRREFTIPFRALNRRGEWIWLEMSVHLSAGDSRNTVSGIGYVKVIEDRKQLERKACIDGLTQLLNRDTAEERVRRCLQEGGEPCCLMLFDVDNFKSVNDLYGHNAGDELLRDVAGAVRSRLRQSDIVGRLGGDEFVALLRNATEVIAREKGQELLTAIGMLSDAEMSECTVSVSIGFACFPQDGQTFQDLYTAADRALYKAKHLGKNRCCSVRESE
ncbi:MAG: EAL domain-containing protein [Clostridiales bacterium]|nr:EAL domain-containing protein [Clostridiales bacterium]